MKVTIGITAYNEERNIGKLLKRLSKERFRFRLNKIIVVASGTDRTEDIIKESAKRNRKIILISENVRKGKSSAVNLVLKNARSEIIVFVCADNLPKKGSIDRLVESFSERDVVAVSGRPVPLGGRDLFGYISHFIWDLHHRYCLIEPKISGELCAIRNIIKKVPSKIINDDGYMNAIMRKKGKIVYMPEAVTYITESDNFLSHIRWRRRIARGYMQLKELNMDVSIPGRTIFRLIAKKIQEEPENILKISLAVILEIIINNLAYYDTIRGHTPYCWKR